MFGRYVAVKSLAWAEIIISARVLLFKLPVLLDRVIAPASHPVFSQNSGWYSLLVTVSAGLYLILGVLSLFQFAVWRSLHYIVAVVLCVLTGIFVTYNQAYSFHYFLPAVLSVLTVIYIIAIKE